MNKKNYLSGWRTVFTFTLNRQIRTTSYIALTVIIAILLFSGVFAGLFIANSSYVKKASLTESSIEKVTVCDQTGTFPGTGWLSSVNSGLFPDVTYTASESAENALASSGVYDLVLVISMENDSYRINIIKPEGTSLSGNEIAEFGNFVSTALRTELIKNSGIDPAALAWLAAPVTSNVSTTEDIGETTADQMRKNINMAVSYIIIFVMYLLTMLYGQGAASVVILEKTSKLMDYFLVSVKPAAMILGKVLASAAAAFIQIAVWIAGALGGLKLALATLPAVFGSVSPDIEQFTGMLGGIGGFLTPGGIVIALVMIAVGFLLYCSLAAIGGSMASKPEDLSSTNMIFTLAVVASFLISMFSGTSGGLVSTDKWLIYFPFTAILVTPGRAMTGAVTITEGIISILLVAVFAFFGILLAGKIYEMMSFYRGNPPTPAKIFAMLRDRKNQ